MDAFLAQSDRDAALCESCVLKEATPKGLAAFAAAADGNQELVDQLLNDPKLMQDILIAVQVRVRVLLLESIDSYYLYYYYSQATFIK